MTWKPLARFRSVAPFLFAAQCLLSGCSHSPESGDWYEKVTTHERIQITGVGTGVDLKNALDEYDKRFAPSVATIKVFYSQADSDEDCIYYTTMRTFNSRYLIEHHIYSEETLDAEYRWVEGASPAVASP